MAAQTASWDTLVVCWRRNYRAADLADFVTGEHWRGGSEYAVVRLIEPEAVIEGVAHGIARTLSHCEAAGSRAMPGVNAVW
jgi:hypothetical protein